MCTHVCACACVCVCVWLGPLTSRDLRGVLGGGGGVRGAGGEQGQADAAAADRQLQSVGLRGGEPGPEQQAVWVPGAELEAHREALRRRRAARHRRRWERQEAAAGAQEGGGHQLGVRAREGHVALETRERERGRERER